MTRGCEGDNFFTLHFKNVEVANFNMLLKAS